MWFKDELDKEKKDRWICSLIADLIAHSKNLWISSTHKLCFDFLIRGYMYPRLEMRDNSWFFRLGMVYHENCYCPMTNIEKWYVAHDCPDTYEQIDKDLSIFKRVNLKKVADEAVSRFNKKGMHSLTHYRIINNKVHRCYRCHSCSTRCQCKQIEDWGRDGTTISLRSCTPHHCTVLWALTVATLTKINRKHLIHGDSWGDGFALMLLTFNTCVQVLSAAQCIFRGGAHCTIVSHCLVFVISTCDCWMFT